eukprot:1329282-Rhodomonas_salina.3
MALAKAAACTILVLAIALCVMGADMTKYYKRTGAKYLEEKAKEEGVKKLPSGMLYRKCVSDIAGVCRVLKEGSGNKRKSPNVGDPCKVTYAGRLKDGTPFDSGTTTFAPNQVPFRPSCTHPPVFSAPVPSLLKRSDRCGGTRSSRDGRRRCSLCVKVTSGSSTSLTIWPTASEDLLPRSLLTIPWFSMLSCTKCSLEGKSARKPRQNCRASWRLQLSCNICVSRREHTTHHHHVDVLQPVLHSSLTPPNW